ncbi:UDP-glycosyltransferase UGT5-like [Diabrotica undecimpunctata]|uniref:UDP-glycosyltransferase UGT5-like n=1 Tax=Diabrotica undecimpunctata TaxID=50387 RepID=UPI003B636EF2
MHLTKVLNIVLLALFYNITFCDSLKILAITPHVGKSHQLVFEPLFKKLVSVGHSVTLITRYPMNLDSPKWRDIPIGSEDTNTTELFDFSLLTGTRLDRYGCPLLLAEAARLSCSEGLSHPNLQRFLKEDNHFDVVLMEVFNTNCFMGIATKYNVPVIGIHSAGWMPWMYQWFGVPYHPGYITDHFLGNTQPMDFLERLENTVGHIYNNAIYKLVMGWYGSYLSNKYVGVDLYENGDIMKNLSLLLINTHFSLNLPLPIGPNVVEIGGIHLESKPNKKLPQDMEKFITDSKHGVIYMCMGSTIRGSSFPESKKQTFLKAFSKLPQRVIWKWEGEMTGRPDNVFVTRWAPQRDILCHPNVKLFITHSGLLGTLEGVDCGKPMLLLPQFGDQFTNAAAVEKVNGGIKLLLSDVTEEILTKTLQNLLSERYFKNAQYLSERFKDRPVSPMNTALYWIDYVVKYNGAPHIKSGAVDLPLYQYYLLDVIAVIFIWLLVWSYLIYLGLKSVVKRCWKRQNKDKKLD